MSASLDETLAFLSSLRTQDLDYEIRKLRAIRAWAIQHTGADFSDGDRVVFVTVPDLDRASGWRPYRECMVVGATATVGEIDFNTAYNYWYASVTFDREWSVSEGVRGPGSLSRYWNGPAAETPDGMKPPSTYDQERYPEGRRHTFAISVRHLRKLETTDE